MCKDKFRFLRDGGGYINPDTHETDRFEGRLFFNEIFFDNSIEEFWNKKRTLANYFDEQQENAIFNYIPPQKANKIFTPKRVVSKMVCEFKNNN